MLSTKIKWQYKGKHLCRETWEKAVKGKYLTWIFSSEQVFTVQHGNFLIKTLLAERPKISIASVRTSNEAFSEKKLSRI